MKHIRVGCNGVIFGAHDQVSSIFFTHLTV
jgi:hypothetical protein